MPDISRSHSDAHHVFAHRRFAIDLREFPDDVKRPSRLGHLDPIGEPTRADGRRFEGGAREAIAALRVLIQTGAIVGFWTLRLARRLRLLHLLVEHFLAGLFAPPMTNQWR